MDEAPRAEAPRVIIVAQALMELYLVAEAPMQVHRVAKGSCDVMILFVLLQYFKKTCLIDYRYT